LDSSTGTWSAPIGEPRSCQLEPRLVRQNNSSARWPQLTKRRTDAFADGLVTARAGFCALAWWLVCARRTTLSSAALSSIKSKRRRATRLPIPSARSQHAPESGVRESHRFDRRMRVHASTHTNSHRRFGLWATGDGTIASVSFKKKNNRISRRMMRDGRTSCCHACMHASMEKPDRKRAASRAAASVAYTPFPAGGTHDFRRHIFAMATLMRTEMSSASDPSSPLRPGPCLSTMHAGAEHRGRENAQAGASEGCQR
jgi:hypothetical protein